MHEGFSDTKLAICGVFLKTAPQLPAAHASVVSVILNWPSVKYF